MRSYDDWKLSPPEEPDCTCGGWWSKDMDCLICGNKAEICSDEPEYECRRCGFEFGRNVDGCDVINWALNGQNNMFVFVGAYNNRRMDSDVVELVDDDFIDLVGNEFGLLIKKGG